jgi:N-sulfoglucosamine sulfohydrolase
MNRRTFLAGLGASAVAPWAASAAAKSSAAANQRRNVLLYVADDWGMNDAGCYGNASIKTPGVDALAREGVRFTKAFCTTPSCSPSRSVILSGKYNHATGQYGLAHAAHHFASLNSVRSLPVMMAEGGYRTICSGKFHVEPEAKYHFDKYLPGGAPAKMADTAREHIAADDKRPFFLYFCPTEPHRPFTRTGSDTFDPAKVQVPSYLPDIPECREELAQYYGSVQRCDSGLVRLMEILKETGRWEDTLVIFISDNGIPFPGAKTNLYDPGCNLPCVIRNPFIDRQGLVNNAMMTWADLTPTILDFAGVTPADSDFHGRSLLPILAQEEPKDWDEICLSHTFHEVTMYYPMRAIRTRRYKLIWNIASGLEYPFASDLWNSKTWQACLTSGIKTYGKREVQNYLHRPAFELYDLENDPDEIHNIANDPGSKDILSELTGRIKEFQKKTQDPWLIKWEHE